MARVYTAEQRAQALAALEMNGGQLRRTAAECGIPVGTLSLWRDTRPECSADAERKPDYVDLFDGLLRAAVARSIAGLPAAPAKDAAVVAGIAADKLLDFRDGRRGTQVNIDARSQHLALPASLTIEELKALAAGGVEPGAR